MQSLEASLVQQDLPGKVAKAVKEFHASISKLGKVSTSVWALLMASVKESSGAILWKNPKNMHDLLQALDKAFIQDITSAYRDVPMDKDVLNRVRTGLLLPSSPSLYPLSRWAECECIASKLSGNWPLTQCLVNMTPWGAIFFFVSCQRQRSNSKNFVKLFTILIWKVLSLALSEIL